MVSRKRKKAKSGKLFEYAVNISLENRSWTQDLLNTELRGNKLDAWYVATTRSVSTGNGPNIFKMGWLQNRPFCDEQRAPGFKWLPPRHTVPTQLTACLRSASALF